MVAWEQQAVTLLTTVDPAPGPACPSPPARCQVLRRRGSGKIGIARAPLPLIRLAKKLVS